MANRIWQSSDGDWSNTDSWGGAIPVDGDDVIVPRTNSVSISTNVDRATIDPNSGLHLNTFTVEEGYTGDIGSSGDELTLTCANRFLYRGSGAMYFSSETQGTNVTSEVIIDSPNINDAAIISSQSTTNGRVSDLYCMRGHTTFNGPGKLDVLHLGAMPGSSGPRVVATSAGTIATVYSNAGSLDLSSDHTFIYQSGGKIVVLEDEPAISSSLQYHVHAGVLEFHGKVSTKQLILYLFGGITDFTKGTVAQKTVWAMTKFPGAQVFANRPWITLPDPYRDFAVETNC